ncbi:MAG: CAP domain-containing protein [Dehalococcoidia bacterium]
MARLRLSTRSRRPGARRRRGRLLTVAATPVLLLALATATLAASSPATSPAPAPTLAALPADAEVTRPPASPTATPRTVFSYWTNASPPFAIDLPPGTAIPLAAAPTPAVPSGLAAAIVTPESAGAGGGMAAGAADSIYLPDVPAGPVSPLEQRLFEGINAERAKAGLPPLAYDDGLQHIARIRSQQMSDQGYFGHRDAAGRTMYVELLAHFGYTYAWAGENLAVNNYDASESAERALTSLLASESHRDNLLTTDFTRVGVGVVSLPDGRHIYTMVFLG